MDDAKKVRAEAEKGRDTRVRGRKNFGTAKDARERAYLQRKMWLNAVNSGLRVAAEETMKVLKYNVVAEDGWVVKVYANGTKERLKQIAIVNRPSRINLK